MEVTAYTNLNNTNNITKDISTKEENTNTSFDRHLEKGNDDAYQKVQQAKETTQKLMDDIRSVLTTGLTVSEIEEMEKLLKDIQSKLKDESKGKSNSIEDIKKMMDKIESEILQLLKDKTGVVIKEAPNDASSQSPNTVSEALSSLMQRVSESLQDIKELKKSTATNGDTVDKEQLPNGIPDDMENNTKKALVKTVNEFSKEGQMILDMLIPHQDIVPNGDGTYSVAVPSDYTYEGMIKRLDTFLESNHSAYNDPQVKEFLGKFKDSLEKNYNDTLNNTSAQNTEDKSIDDINEMHKNKKSYEASLSKMYIISK